MIKIPKYFDSEQYIKLNNDIKYKGTDPTTHFLTFGYAENRKYNELININYPFVLHLINIDNTSYNYFYDLLIDFKLLLSESNFSTKFSTTNYNGNKDVIDSLIQIKKTLNIDLNYNITPLIFDLLIDKSYKYIKKGIFSDRDLLKHYNDKQIYDILSKLLNNVNTIFDYSTNKYNDYSVNDNISDIFKVTNKFEFFYRYFRWFTNHIIKYGFEIKNSPNNTKTAVIIESRNHILFKYIVYNIMFNLGSEWNLHIFCGYDNYYYIKDIFPNVKITLLPFYNFSVDIYDFICLNNFFWNSIDTEDILIFQTDTYLVDNMNDILLNNYVYLGAPHRNVHGNISYLTPNNFGLNGGLSLRKKYAMLQCINNIKGSDIDKYRLIKGMDITIRTPINYYDINYNFILSKFKGYDNININASNICDIATSIFNTDLIFEDVYYSHAIEMLGYPIPNNYIARHFVIQEDVYGKIYNVRGVHGWDKPYLNLDFHKEILKKYTFKLINKVNNNQNLIKFYNTNTNTNIDNDNKVLIIAHNMKGGTEKYVKDVININKYVSYDILRIKESNIQSTNIIFNDTHIKLLHDIPNFLKNRNYKYIHIHYFNEPAFILYDYIIELLDSSPNTKLIVTLHDYHFITNDKLNEYHLTIFNSNENDLYLLKNNKIDKRVLHNYRKLFMKSYLLITGSYKLRNIYNFLFDLPTNLIKVCPHPEKIYFSPIDLNEYNINFSELNIGVIGAIAISKGSYMIQDMSNYIIKSKVPWKIFHIGGGFNSNPKKISNIHFMGPYNSEIQLRDILVKNKINILWFPAFRHESFCYTLTLAIQTCLPIIAYDSGTFKERLSKYKYPYFIQQSKYTCEALFEDINTFWEQLNETKYISTSSELNNDVNIYDNIDYTNIYK
jgi:hypothetical protein